MPFVLLQNRCRGGEEHGIAGGGAGRSGCEGRTNRSCKRFGADGRVSACAPPSTPYSKMSPPRRKPPASAPAPPLPRCCQGCPRRAVTRPLPPPPHRRQDLIGWRGPVCTAAHPAHIG